MCVFIGYFIFVPGCESCLCKRIFVTPWIPVPLSNTISPFNSIILYNSHPGLGVVTQRYITHWVITTTSSPAARE